MERLNLRFYTALLAVIFATGMAFNPSLARAQVAQQIDISDGTSRELPLTLLTQRVRYNVLGRCNAGLRVRRNNARLFEDRMLPGNRSGRSATDEAPYAKIAAAPGHLQLVVWRLPGTNGPCAVEFTPLP